MRLPINLLLFVSLALATLKTAYSGSASSAIMHGREIYVVLGSSTHQLTNDGRSKFSRHWSPDGMRLAYMEDANPGHALPSLKVIEAFGNPTVSIPIFPGRLPWATSGEMTPSTVEINRWLDGTRIALEGNLSGWVRMLIVADTGTGKMSHAFDQLGQCGSFEFSPDLHHVLAQENGRSNAEVNWSNSLSIDKLEVFPKRGEPLIRFQTDPR